MAPAAVETNDSRPESGARSSIWKAVAAVVVVGVLFALSRIFDVQGAITTALEWVQSLGFLGYAVFVLIYVVACVFFIPGSLLTLGAGAIYGLLTGFILVSIGSTLGATAAFLVGRYFARDWVAAKVSGNARFRVIDEAVGKEGWKIVGLTRLSPVFPFTLLNYAYGLTKVSLPHYVIASWIGMMPGTVMYVYIGTLAGNIATLGTEESDPGAGRLVLQVVGLLATIAVTVYVTHVARRALKQEVGEPQEESTA